MIRKYLLGLGFYWGVSTASAIMHPTIVWDDKSSPYMGSTIITTALRGYQELDDRMFNSTAQEIDSVTRTVRSAKFLAELTLSSWASVWQHEYFGHGYRGRELGVDALHYRVTPFSGYVSFNALQYDALHPQKKAAIDTAGMEANYELAKYIRSNWLNSQMLDSREASLYLLSSLDQFTYIRITSRLDKTRLSSGNDVYSYINDVNSWQQKPYLQRRKLGNTAYIDLLDPYLWFSFYNIGNYIMEGESQFNYPMFTIGDYSYLPGMRLGLAPYGIEYNLINYIRTPERFIEVGIRHGNNNGKTSWGIDGVINNVAEVDAFKFDLRLSMWQQPRLFTPTQTIANPRLGALASVTGKYLLTGCLYIVGELGIKSQGFVPGYNLANSTFGKVGLSFDI